MKQLSLFTLALLICALGQASESIDKEVAPPPLIISPLPKAEAPLPRTSTTRDLSGETTTGVVSRVPAKRARTWMMSFGPGLMFYNGPDAKQTNSGMVGFSSHFGGVTQLTSDSPFFLGLDLGLQFWSFGDRHSEHSATGLQVLPTAYYNFDWNFESSFQPYLGAAVGPHVYFSRKGGNTDVAVNFEFLLRPGVTFLMAPGLSMNFEPKIGFLGDALVFCPQIAANLFL